MRCADGGFWTSRVGAAGLLVAHFPEEAGEESGEGECGPEQEDEKAGEALAEGRDLGDAADFEGWAEDDGEFGGGLDGFGFGGVGAGEIELVIVGGFETGHVVAGALGAGFMGEDDGTDVAVANGLAACGAREADGKGADGIVNAIGGELDGVVVQESGEDPVEREVEEGEEQPDGGLFLRVENADGDDGTEDGGDDEGGEGGGEREPAVAVEFGWHRLAVDHLLGCGGVAVAVGGELGGGGVDFGEVGRGELDVDGDDVFFEAM